MHSKQISQLNASNAQVLKDNSEIRRKIFELKSAARAPLVLSPSSCEITISGVPHTISDSTELIVDRMFDSRGVTGLAGDVLKIRSLSRNMGSGAGYGGWYGGYGMVWQIFYSTTEVS